MSDTRSNEITPPGSMPREHDWFVIKRFVIVLIAAALLFMVVGVFYAKVVIPVMVSVFLAYLVVPLVDALERRKVNRGVASVLILFLFLGGLTIAALRLGPFLYDQLVGLVHQIPALIDSLGKNGAITIRGWARDLGMGDLAPLERALKGYNLTEQAVARAQNAVEGIWVTGANIMGSIVSAILVPFLTFFLVLEKPHLIESGKRVVPRDVRPYVARLAAALDVTMKAVVRGHLKVALTLAVLYSVGFSVAGLSAGVAIGIAAGICRVIPYLDAVVGITLGVTYVFASGMPPAKVFAVLAVVGFVQVVDGAVITPKLIGGRVGLHPVVVILTIIAAGYHFGFLGVLLAIPLAASVKTIYKLALPAYRDSRWFRGVTKS